jgi:PIN domain nuclease of toxin-antitoxin system
VKLLLDTHALVWLIADDARIGRQAREVIIDPGNEVFVSIVSFWELAVKIRIGKLKKVELEKVMSAVLSYGFALLHLEPRHVLELIKLPFHPDHRDPFDHQLIAQAIAEDLIFVSEDLNTLRYPVQRIACSDGATSTL